MTRDDCADVLRHVAGGLGLSVLPRGQSTFELKPAGSGQSKRTTLVAFYADPDADDEVATVLCSCVVGRVHDPRALQPLLAMNRGGVLRTEFYFSTHAVNTALLLLLETRQWVDAELDHEGARTFLHLLLTNPLFLQTWDFPDGVENYLW